MGYVLRDFRAEDAEAVNRTALQAFDEYRKNYSDWPAMTAHLGAMASLSLQGEIIVADTGDVVAGAVAYIGPDIPKASFFKPDCPIIRMLVVHPDHRGKGLGRALTEECISRARRDGASCIALHTTPIMAVALSMYQRMGFEYYQETPPIYGVPYSVYLKQL